MNKNMLLIIPFLTGLLLMIYSWYSSFPISVGPFGDSIFNHVSIYYWFSIPLLLTSMFLIAIRFNNKYLKWIMAVGSVTVLYSLSYFYYTMSTSDAEFFRGLTENFIKTNNLNASQIIHSYYQWPSFFLLSKIATSISGLPLVDFEFLLFTVIGFTISTALYVYVSKAFSQGSFLAVVIFFIVMFFFLNYQDVPFSIAFGLLVLLFVVDIHKKSPSIMLTILILYASIAITHAFVPLFFVLYLIIKIFVGENKQSRQYYFRFSMMAIIIYVLVQITLGRFTFLINMIQAFTLPSEYSRVVSITLAQVQVQTDITAQLISRAVTVAFALLCFAGFVILAVKRKLRETDKAIFLSGAIYLAVGVILSTLGSRAIALVFIPISLGIAYLYENLFRRLKPFLKYFVLILLILSVFALIHSSFATYPITIQTKGELATANIMIEKYDWRAKSLVIADSGPKWYISTQIQGNTEVDTDLAPSINLSNITNYDCIIYSVGLAHTLQISNISIEETSQQIIDKFNLVYNSGTSYIATKSG